MESEKGCDGSHYYYIADKDMDELKAAFGVEEDK